MFGGGIISNLPDIEEFSPRFALPTTVEFLNFMAERGFSSRVADEIFDFYVLDGNNDPYVAVKAVKNRISKHIRRKLTTTRVPYKVIVYEGAKPKFSEIDASRIFYAATGTGVFVRNVGWLVKPKSANHVELTEIRYKMAPRWHFLDGAWWKTCTSCGVDKNPDEFYDAAYATQGDPKRNICKTCMKQKHSADRRVRQRIRATAKEKSLEL